MADNNEKQENNALLSCTIKMEKTDGGLNIELCLIQNDKADVGPYEHVAIAAALVTALTEKYDGKNHVDVLSLIAMFIEQHEKADAMTSKMIGLN